MEKVLKLILFSDKFQHVIVIRSDPQESLATTHPDNVHAKKE
jgi:hypothetical protein